jgi:phage shock protein A
MKESIATRVGRIVSGGANKLIDMLENAAPEMVLEEALREIDEAIYDVKTELGKAMARKYLANSRLSEMNRSHDDLTEKVQFALEQNREDLAEAAISKQLDIEAQIPVLETSISEFGKQEKEMEKYVSALLAKKRELSRELKEFRDSRENTAKDNITVPNAFSGAELKVNKAESVFDRILEKNAVASTSLKTESKLAELEDLSRTNMIKERLAQFRSKAQL